MNMPNPVQKYIIMPNEIDAERPFIANNIKATLDAYKLAQVDVRDFRYGLSVDQQRMYYGMQGYPWAVAPKQAGEMDYPKGDRNVMADYTGEGGIPIGSVLKQLLFASYFKDRDLFFSTRFNANSRILIRRNVMERVRYLVPYLKLDRSPYAVATSSGVFWILDAYTTSRWYPAAAPYDHDGMTFNYIRNSVKIAVDAFNGNVDFCLEDPTDPIARAYQRIYPGLLKDKSQMPAELRQHIRYPEDIYDIQMIILTIGNSVFFIQPVYLKFTSRVKIPELQRIIMSDGQFVVMETSLDKAYDLIKRREA